MLINAAAPAILALNPLSAMLTNAAAPAILTPCPPSAMLTNAAAPRILAICPLFAVLTNGAVHFSFMQHFRRLAYRHLFDAAVPAKPAALFRTPSGSSQGFLHSLWRAIYV